MNVNAIKIYQKNFNFLNQIVYIIISWPEESIHERKDICVCRYILK